MDRVAVDGALGAAVEHPTIALNPIQGMLLSDITVEASPSRISVPLWLSRIAISRSGLTTRLPMRLLADRPVSDPWVQHRTGHTPSAVINRYR